MSAPLEQLVALSEVKEHLNLSLTESSNDAELQGFIDAATAYIQNATGPIIPRQYVEVHNGGGPTVVLFNPPVVSVDSVVEYIGPTGYTLTQAELGTDAGTYAFSLDSAEAGIISRRFNGGMVGCFAGGLRNVQVTYTAGRASVPADVRMAVLQDIAGLWGPSQTGPASPMFPDVAGGGPQRNPLTMFPRVAEVLSAATTRTPSIA